MKLAEGWKNGQERKKKKKGFMPTQGWRRKAQMRQPMEKSSCSWVWGRLDLRRLLPTWN